MLLRREAAEVEPVIQRLALVRIFDRDRRRPTRAERRRVGEGLRLEVGHAEQRRVDVVVGPEVEERLDATGREAAELDVTERDVDRADAAGSEERGRSHNGLAAAEEDARVAGDLVADEGAQQAVFGRLAEVEVETAAGPEAGGVEVAPARLHIQIVGSHVAADPQADIRARKEPIACSVGGADANVIDRCGLLHGKIRGLCPGYREKTRGRPEEKALNELHSDLQSFETLGGPGCCASTSLARL